MQRQGSLDVRTYKPIVLGVVPDPPATSAHKPSPMSAIEKLQESWTSSTITTLFRMGSLTTSNLKSIHFPVAGFSWCLVVRGSSGRLRRPTLHPSRRQLFFYSSSCPGTWCGTPVNITVSFPSHLDGDTPKFCIRSIATVLGNDVLICSDPPLLQNALVSLEVTFTNLLTCNLLNVLANVVPRAVTDAPLEVSYQEPRGPQASSGLRALKQSFKTGISFDIVFQAYTRRSSLGSVTRPIPIYANTDVLQDTTLLPDFDAEEDTNLSSLFELSEGDTLPFTSLKSYEYDESDSDLEDDNHNHSSIHNNNLAVVQPVEELATTSSDEASASHDVRSHTPESPEDAIDTISASSFSSIEVELQEQLDNRSSLLEGVEMAPVVIGESLKHDSRVILIKGVAWKTWYTFICYCYTGIIIFTDLRSQSTSDVRSCLEDGPPHCSPKSMYQLARKLNNEPLSQLALKAIETRLSAANILDEAFSKFTSRHDAVKEMEIALLLQHRSAPEVLQGLPAKIQAVAMGNLPHAASALTALYQQITQMPGQN